MEKWSLAFPKTQNSTRSMNSIFESDLEKACHCRIGFLNSEFLYSSALIKFYLKIKNLRKDLAIGRQSGGERSVATMLFLLSMPPAHTPFRLGFAFSDAKV